MTNPSGSLVGRTIAHYEILARLGGGGMGVVYKARDVRLGRIVALKFLPPQWSHDEDAKQRFIREAQAASATDHRNIGTIHDIAAADDGQLFIVMAYYEGPTLKQRLEAGALPIEEALDIATQIADGLARAHAQGVVHRDIKPGNLILADDGLRIVDFGLATFADALQLTIAGSTLGTAAYMSPEQVRGEAVDARTDVWAVGVILYQMLTGHVPFRGTYAEAIAHAIRTDPPASIRAERPEVPEEVEQVVFRALHKEPAIRFASGRELARALRQVRGQTVPIDLNTQPIVVPAAPPAPRRRRGRRLAIAAAVAAAAIAAGGAWVMRPIARPLVAVVPVANQTGLEDMQAYQRALTHTLVRELADSPAVRPLSWGHTVQMLHAPVAAGAAINGLEAIQGLAATGARFLIVPTLIQENGQWRVRVAIREAAQQVDIGTYESPAVASSLRKETARDLMFAAADLVRDHFEPRWQRWLRRGGVGSRLRTLDAAVAFERGLSWYEEQEYAAAYKEFESAAAQDPQSALARAWASRAARLMRRDIEVASQAEAAARLGTDRLQRADRLFIDAVVAEARGDRDSADAAYNELAETFADDPAVRMEHAAYLERRADDKDGWSAAVQGYHAVLSLDKSLIRPQLELCRLYNRLQDFRKAVEYGNRALVSYQQAGWPGGEAQARFCLTDAHRLGPAGGDQQAVAHAEAALKILQRAGFSYNVPRALYYLGLIAGEQGRLADAIAYWEEATKTAEEGGNLALRASVFNNLGVAHHRLGRGSVALEHYRQSAALYEALGDERGAARQEFNSASLRVTYGANTEQAITQLRNALTVIRRRGDPDFEIACLEVIAAHYRNTGQYSAAATELDRARNLADQYSLAPKIRSVALETARLKFAQSDYAAALPLLEGVIAKDSGRVATQARLLRARVYTRVGAFQSAAADFDAVEEDVSDRNDTGLLPTLNGARGELEYESGQLAAAERHLAAAAPFGNDTFVDEAAVRALAYLGTVHASLGNAAKGRSALEASITQARAMGRVEIEAVARIFLARLLVEQGNRRVAAQTLDPVSVDTVSLETRAMLHYWRGRALDGPAAAEQHAAARAAVDRLQAPLAADARSSLAGRRDVGIILLVR